jgi:hypothetical protein
MIGTVSPSARTCSIRLQPSVPGQHQVEDADVGPLEAQLAQGAIAVVCVLDVEARLPEMAPHHAREDRIVLHDQHRRHERQSTDHGRGSNPGPGSQPPADVLYSCSSTRPVDPWWA